MANITPAIHSLCKFLNYLIAGVIRRAIEQEGTIWTYPMGRLGPDWYSRIKVAFGYSKVQRIDNKLCSLNHDILSLKDAANVFKQSDILLLTSENIEVYGSLRIEGVRDKIPAENIINIFGGGAFRNCDKRLYHLVHVSDEIYRNNTKP